MVSLVHCDGSSKGGTPTSPLPWAVGFSETPGERNRSVIESVLDSFIRTNIGICSLCIAQIRRSDLEKGSGLFGLVDGGLNGAIPCHLRLALPSTLLDVLHDRFR